MSIRRQPILRKNIMRKTIEIRIAATADATELADLEKEMTRNGWELTTVVSVAIVAFKREVPEPEQPPLYFYPENTEAL